MASPIEREAMAQAIAEAKRGRPSPNPRVGAAIIDRDAILAVGYHRKAGEAHAEVDAIRNAGGRVEGMTLVVTLEPCNHHGRTGPCTEVILSSGIRRVVIGCRDPAPHVPGAIERLKSGGVEVEVGLMQAECAALVADFAKHIETGLPHVTLKAAITLDGKIATRTGASKWITGEAARTEAHRMRDEADAVLVGLGTVVADDPSLTVRHVRGRNPIRVVLDPDLRTPSSATVLDPARSSQAPTLIFHADDAQGSRRAALERPHVELIAVPRDPHGVHLAEVLKVLGSRDVLRLLVEGGARVHGSFLDLALADRLAIFIAPRIFGSQEAPSFAAGAGAASIEDARNLVRTEVRTLGSDWLITGELERMQ